MLALNDLIPVKEEKNADRENCCGAEPNPQLSFAGGLAGNAALREKTDAAQTLHEGAVKKNCNRTVQPAFEKIKGQEHGHEHCRDIGARRSHVKRR